MEEVKTQLASVKDSENDQKPENLGSKFKQIFSFHTSKNKKGSKKESNEGLSFSELLKVAWNLDIFPVSSLTHRHLLPIETSNSSSPSGSSWSQLNSRICSTS